MADRALEENQAAGYSDVVGTFEFICEHGAVVSHKSAEAVALKPGARLHFLRYGYVEKSSTKDAGLFYDGPRGGEGSGYLTSEVACTQSEMPDLPKFYKARTRLNRGYIYLINDDNPSDHFEYEVSEFGTLSTVTWARNKDANGKYLDCRKADGDRREYKIMAQGKRLWVAYSRYQWSAAYHYRMCTDGGLREKRMTLIDASGIKKGSEDAASNVVPYNELRTSWKRDDAYYNWYAKHLQEIHADETDPERGEY